MIVKKETCLEKTTLGQYLKDHPEQVIRFHTDGKQVATPRFGRELLEIIKSERFDDCILKEVIENEWDSGYLKNEDGVYVQAINVNLPMVRLSNEIGCTVGALADNLYANNSMMAVANARGYHELKALKYTLRPKFLDISKNDSIIYNDVKITKITNEQMSHIIEYRLPKGAFYCFEGEHCVACDNRTGDAWTEQWETLDKAFKYLADEIEVEI